METINGFRGKFSFLSNMYECPIHATIRGRRYYFRCAESLFQALKDPRPEVIAKFTGLTGAEAKRLGKKVALREDWEDIKLDVMASVIKLKFTQNNDLKNKLIDTADVELVEYNTWHDTYWGVCNNVGSNNLGEILMQFRSVLVRSAN